MFPSPVGDIIAIDIETVEFGSQAFETVRTIRNNVFVLEQGVEPAGEFDALEASAVHLLARVRGHPAGVARLYAEAGVPCIGRVAVLPAYRKAGVGRALMEYAMDLWRARGADQIQIHAQIQAAGFYRKLGFVVDGEEFLEEGIPHVTMVYRIKEVIDRRLR